MNKYYIIKHLQSKKLKHLRFTKSQCADRIINDATQQKKYNLTRTITFCLF